MLGQTRLKLSGWLRLNSTLTTVLCSCSQRQWWQWHDTRCKYTHWCISNGRSNLNCTIVRLTVTDSWPPALMILPEPCNNNNNNSNKSIADSRCTGHCMPQSVICDVFAALQLSSTSLVAFTTKCHHNDQFCTHLLADTSLKLEGCRSFYIVCSQVCFNRSGLLVHCSERPQRLLEVYGNGHRMCQKWHVSLMAVCYGPVSVKIRCSEHQTSWQKLWLQPTSSH